MADDLSLLFRLRAQNQASPVIKTVEGDIQKLSSSTTTHFNSMQQVSTVALSKISQSITNLAGQVPVLGNAVSGLSSELSSMAGEATAAGSEFAAIAGPIGIAVVAIGAAAAASIKLTEALFDLTKAAAESQGKLFDLSQQTGVSVETLSALQFLAETTGGNIEAVSASLGIFQKNLEASQDATTKQAEAFKSLGVDVTTTEETLRATLKALGAMPEGFRQTALALQIFGRGGKQILAILKEANGEIDTTIDKLAAMGIGSSEAARQADQFNDELIKLHTQIQGIVNILGNEMIPEFLTALQTVEQFIKVSKDGFAALGSVLGLFVRQEVFKLAGELQILRDVWTVAQPILATQVELYERWAAAIQIISGNIPNISGNEIGPINLGGGASDGRKELQGLLQRAAATEEGNKNLQDLTRKFDLQNIFGNFDKQKAADLQAALEKQKQLQQQINEIKKKTAEVDREIAAEQEKRQRAIEAEIASLDAFIAAQTRAINGEQTELDKTNEFILRFENLSGGMDEATQAWLRFRAVIIDTNEDLKDLPEFIRETAKAMAELGPQFTEGTAFPGVDALNALAPQIPKVLELQKAFDDLGESIRKVFDGSKDFKLQFGDVIGGALADLEQGIASLVEQYVLLGTTGPAALRKLLAATLAHLAAEASVKAVFQLAEGFAALFVNPAEAAAHFTSAAIFGSIAGVAAVAGRSVAGDLFQQKPSGSNAQTQGSGALPTIVQGRNQAAPPVVHIDVRHDEGVVVRTWTDDFRNGGITRQTVQGDGR